MAMCMPSGSFMGMGGLEQSIYFHKLLDGQLSASSVSPISYMLKNNAGGRKEEENGNGQEITEAELLESLDLV